MQYNSDLRRWELDMEDVRSELGFDLLEFVDTGLSAVTATARANKILRDVSQKVYNYIYSFNPANRQVLEFALATENSLIQTLQEVMMDEVDYVIKNGDFYNFAGVNIVKGTAIAKEQLRGRDMLLSPMSELKLESARVGAYPLLSAVEYPLRFKEIAREWRNKQ